MRGVCWCVSGVVLFSAPIKGATVLSLSLGTCFWPQAGETSTGYCNISGLAREGGRKEREGPSKVNCKLQLPGCNSGILFARLWELVLQLPFLAERPGSLTFPGSQAGNCSPQMHCDGATRAASWGAAVTHTTEMSHEPLCIGVYSQDHLGLPVLFPSSSAFPQILEIPMLQLGNWMFLGVW